MHVVDVRLMKKKIKEHVQQEIKKRTRTDGWSGRSKLEKSIAEQEISILYFSIWIRTLIHITRDKRYIIGLGFLSVQVTLSSPAPLHKEKGHIQFPYSGN